MKTDILYYFVALPVLSFLLTCAVRKLTKRADFVDIPNHRSSHSVPTPKGGGIAIMVTMLLAFAYAYRVGHINSVYFWSLMCVIPVAAISLVDDAVSLSPKVRLVVQVASACLALLSIGGVTKIEFVIFKFTGLWANVVCIVAIVWLTNLYNFMDGIDGYAGSEAVFVGLAAYYILNCLSGLIIALTVTGFLFLNWHKATIFMGDIGSASLGFVFAVLSVLSAEREVFLVWPMMLALFWFDASLTLIRRVIKREKLSQAHKSHEYQKLLKLGYSHSQIVIMGMVVNLFTLVLLLCTPNHLLFYALLAECVVLTILVLLIDRRVDDLAITANQHGIDRHF